MERDQAVRLTQNLLKKMVDNNGSDLFITADFPPAIKIDGTIRPFADRPLTSAQASLIVRSIMNDKQAKEFDATKECNFAIAPQGIGRFRVSAFVQQGHVGAVIRTIVTKIPSFEDLDLPSQLKDVAMTKRGLCLVVGGTGSGKSTTLAAMIGYRNENSRGHIITIEDPVEYVHPHRGCVVTHREVGVDTDNWFNALKNTLRQAPDVIMIGEIRDKETAQIAVEAALTGHLILSTLHTNDAPSAVTRLVDMGVEPFLLASTLRGVLAHPRATLGIAALAGIGLSLGLGRPWPEANSPVADPEFDAALPCHGDDVDSSLLAVRVRMNYRVHAGLGSDLLEIRERLVLHDGKPVTLMPNLLGSLAVYPCTAS